MKRRALLAVPLAAPALAQEAWPTRPVRIVVAFPPGGGSDLMARAVAPRMSEALGQPIIVENRSGAGGTVGTHSVAQARADGYTLLFANGGEFALKPLLDQRMPYDAQRDFTPVVLLGVTPVVLAVHPSTPARSFAEFLALARARPGAVTVANSGSGNVMHLTAAYVAHLAGIELAHVPYRGAAPAVADAVAGTVMAVVSGLPPVLAQARQDRLRILAVAVPRRTPAIPDVPTLSELGLPGFDMSNTVGLVAPAGTPPSVLAAINRAANSAIADPEVRRIFQANGAEPRGSTAAEYVEFLAGERARFAQALRATGIRME
jgi:tripartite-type tricarboxylate transporter receptor subunit TctC